MMRVDCSREREREHSKHTEREITTPLTGSQAASFANRTASRLCLEVSERGVIAVDGVIHLGTTCARATRRRRRRRKVDVGR